MHPRCLQTPSSKLFKSNSSVYLSKAPFVIWLMMSLLMAWVTLALVFQMISASSKISKHVEWTVYILHLLQIMSTVCDFQILQVRVGWQWWVKETFYRTIQIHGSNHFSKQWINLMDFKTALLLQRQLHMKTNNVRWIWKISDLRISKIFKFIQIVYKRTPLLFIRHQKF